MSIHTRSRIKLISGFAFLLVLFGIMGGIAFYALHISQKSAGDAIASQEILDEMQYYGQCAQSVLLQTAMGLLLENANEVQEKQKAIDSEIKAIEERMTHKFTGEDAEIFDEVKSTYQHFINDNNRWFEIETRRIEKKAEFGKASERTVQAMENCIEAFQKNMNISEGNDSERDYGRFAEYIRKMDTGLGRISFLRYSFFDLWDEQNSDRKKETALQLMGEINALTDYFVEVKKIVGDPVHQELIDQVIDAVNDWGGILESILEMMAEQNQILRKHSTDDVKMLTLLDTLTSNVRKHTELTRKLASDANTRLIQMEIAAAFIAVVIGLTLAYATLRFYASSLEQEVNVRTAEVFHLQTAVLDTVADMVEFRDQLTGGHNQRTKRYLQILTEELIRTETYKDEVSGWNINFLLSSAQLHDVGKIAIPDSILNKPGKLSEVEYDVMQTHVAVGVDALERIMSNTNEHAFLRHAVAIAGTHHEKWDGSGYPAKLKGNNIPLEGRLMAIADVYDALISVRPYKKALTHSETCEIIEKGAGTHFDPVLIETFRRVKDKFFQVVEEGRSVLLKGGIKAVLP